MLIPIHLSFQASVEQVEGDKLDPQKSLESMGLRVTCCLIWVSPHLFFQEALGLLENFLAVLEAL